MLEVFRIWTGFIHSLYEAFIYMILFQKLLMRLCYTPEAYKKHFVKLNNRVHTQIPRLTWRNYFGTNISKLSKYEKGIIKSGNHGNFRILWSYIRTFLLVLIPLFQYSFLKLLIITHIIYIFEILKEKSTKINLKSKLSS